MKKLIGLLSVAFLVTLAVAGTASADPVTIPLSDFVIFSGGGLAVSGDNETEIGGHTDITGNIGSNQDLFLQGNPLTGYPAQLNGSAYAGGNLFFGQDLTVGSSLGPLREVVVNGDAFISGGTIGVPPETWLDGATIYGTLDANLATVNGTVTGTVTTGSSADTFALISMPAPTSFTAGGEDQTIPAPSGTSLALDPGTYGALSTTRQDQTLILSSGNYYFDSITAQGGFTLEIDLTSGQPINIYVVGLADFKQNNTLMVKGAGTDGAFVPISDASHLAALIYLETHDRFVMTGSTRPEGNIWGGTVYASLLEGNDPEVAIGQYMNWYGAVYAFDSVDFADHGNWNHVPLGEPEPPDPNADPAIAVVKSVSLDCGETWDDADEAPGPTVELTNDPDEINRDLDSYVLLALDQLNFKGGNDGDPFERGYVLGGNVGVNNRDPKLNDNTIQLNVGANGVFVMSDGTQLVGGSIKLGEEASVWDVHVAAEKGSGWGKENTKIGGNTIRNIEYMIDNDTDLPIIPLSELTTDALCGDFDPVGTTDFNAPKNGPPVTLAPGAYRDVNVQNGGTLYLQAGDYTVRRFTTGQNVTVYTEPETVIHVWGDGDPNAVDFNLGGNGSYFGSAVPGVESVARICVSDEWNNNAGDANNSHVQFSDNGEFWGVIYAPGSSINLGRNFTHYGRFVGRTIGSDFNVNVTYRNGDTESCPPDIVRFRFVVTNTGDVPLTSIALTDEVKSPEGAAALDMSDCDVPFSLAPDDGQPGGPDEFECIVTAPAVEGQHHNTATATGYYFGTPVTDQDDAYYFGLVQ